MLITSLATAPFVAHVHVQLPSHARRSEQTLRAFLRSPPKSTLLTISAMRFLPWPKTRTVYLEDMRAIKPSFGRIANFEHVPLTHHDKKVPGWMRATLGQYFVRPGERFTKNTRAPGAWDMLVNHIRENTERPRDGRPLDKRFGKKA